MQLVVGTPDVLPSALCAGMARYRYKVFVEKLGWSLQCSDGVELDEFDRSETVYIIAQDEQGLVVGTARLLPTTQPYLFSTAFRSLWGSGELPNSPDVWELSRFSAFDHQARQDKSGLQFGSTLAAVLLNKCLECARQLGAKSVVTVSPVGAQRLLARAGFGFQRTASPQLIGGEYLVGLVISCEV